MSRDWNDKLRRRLQDSICLAADRPRATRLLVTDLEDCDQTLVEVIGLVEGKEQVVAEFLFKTTNRPQRLRYRQEQGWPK
jgi:hypothetical protein